MSRLTRSCAVLVACAAVAAPATAANADAGGGPVATASKACKLTLTEQRNMGTTYVFSLSVSGGVSCSTGKTIAKAFNACRLKNGTKGRCVRKVSGYSCGETRTNSSPFSFDATATCKNGKKKVVQKYQQNT